MRLPATTTILVKMYFDNPILILMSRNETSTFSFIYYDIFSKLGHTHGKSKAINRFAFVDMNQRLFN
ncbi:hypothetical protein A7D17_14975 [Xanthomonas floridensis]|uniref:Uncharacterized protein n=1 Tax=Xanthomonas floridensis TaxID=1843580 RepID=A0A1A9MD02_9XANT|nr:hypothetical protein A7D17_14975 [Xanthomonas floridensis]